MLLAPTTGEEGDEEAEDPDREVPARSEVRRVRGRGHKYMTHLMAEENRVRSNLSCLAGWLFRAGLATANIKQGIFHILNLKPQ